MLPDSRELADLPFLNAVIHEGLRLRNNMPDAEPRLTPRGYHSSNIGSLHGLPPGIRVGAYFWALHRDEAVFPNPEAWDPSRWTGADDKNRNPNKYLYAFGHGSRGCVGQQLAMERKYGVVRSRHSLAGFFFGSITNRQPNPSHALCHSSDLHKLQDISGRRKRISRRRGLCRGRLSRKAVSPFRADR